MKIVCIKLSKGKKKDITLQKYAEFQYKYSKA